MKSKYGLIQGSSTHIFTLPPKIVSEIKSFRNLKKGWDCGEGDRISDYVIDKAINIYYQVNPLFFNYEATPISNDSIKLTFYLNDHFVDLVIYKSKIEVIYEQGTGYNFQTILHEDNMKLLKIKNLLKTIHDKCYSLERSTLQNTVEAKKDLKVFSRTIKAGSLSSTMTVQLKSPEVFALTSRTTTKKPSVSQ